MAPSLLTANFVLSHTGHAGLLSTLVAVMSRGGDPPPQSGDICKMGGVVQRGCWIEVVSPGAIIGGHCRVEVQSPKVAAVSQYSEQR